MSGHVHQLHLPGYEPTDNGVKEWVIVHKVVLRAECGLESAKLFDVRPGTIVHILEVCETPNANLRAAVSFQSGGTRVGWLTAIANGKATLQLLALSSTDAAFFRRAACLFYSPYLQSSPDSAILPTPDEASSDGGHAASAAVSSAKKTPLRRRLAHGKANGPSTTTTPGLDGSAIADGSTALQKSEILGADASVIAKSFANELALMERRLIDTMVALEVARSDAAAAKASAPEPAPSPAASAAEAPIAPAAAPELTKKERWVDAVASTASNMKDVSLKMKRAIAASTDKLMDLFIEWDTDGNGEIDRDEFRKGMMAVAGKHKVETNLAEIDALFNLWDPDCSGTIDFEELSSALKGFERAQKHKSAVELQRMIKERHLKARKPQGGSAAKKSSSSTNSTSASQPAQKEQEPDPNQTPDEEAEGEWSAAKWMSKLGIAKIISEALNVPSRDEMPAIKYIRRLKRPEIENLMSRAMLSGLTDAVVEGVEALQAQKIHSASALNDKFQATGKFQMSYGSLSLFYGGLESLLGPPQMHKDEHSEDGAATLLKAMENEHCVERDANEKFTTTNGMTTTSRIEWEVVYSPKKKPDLPDGVYPERNGLRESNPDQCRVAKSLAAMLEVMELEANVRLRRAGHAEMIVEELVAGRLYTGPMYMKYNAVLRAKSKVAFLMQQARTLTKGNDYATSIHACNSCVLKLSKLTKACKVWRGIKDAKLPKEFWVPNEMGVRGGIEYGFSSTTTDKSQAVVYASGDDPTKDAAMTIFEMQMGMVDRGADLTWLSQYPHEREVLLPPLTGIEALASDVEGSMLVIHSRLSLNLAAQTLEQVLSRRRKMLMDMATGIELELREALNEVNYPMALKILRAALQHGAYAKPPEWFNNDDHFARVMQETLYLQRALINDIDKLRACMDKHELNLRGWKARGPGRIPLLRGFVYARTAIDGVAIDLREAHLTPEDGVILADLMAATPKLLTVDVRGNESLGEVGTAAFVSFLATQKVKSSVSIPRSICGVTPSKPRLEVPKSMPEYESSLLCAELEANVFAEGISAGMGGKAKKSATLNRRGVSAAEQWQPLIWAAKDNNLLIAKKLLDNGHDVNKKEPSTDKGNSGYAPIHWAAQKGHAAMIDLLIEHGANPAILDKHGNTARSLAEKRGDKEVVQKLTDAPNNGKNTPAPSATKKKS